MMRPMAWQIMKPSLIIRGDSWLKACMLHTIGEKGIVELQDYVKEERGSSNPLIRESAELAWRKLSGLIGK